MSSDLEGASFHVVTVRARAGMNVERLEEFPGEADWRFGDLSAEARRLPSEYLLVATRE